MGFGDMGLNLTFITVILVMFYVGISTAFVPLLAATKEQN
jgi:hypothetical protein